MLCKKCGQALRPKAKFCAKCGTPVPTEPIHVDPPLSPAKDGLCKACGAKLRPGAKFCAKCGASSAPVVAPGPEITKILSDPPLSPEKDGLCKACGAKLRPGATFCAKCGASSTSVVTPGPGTGGVTEPEDTGKPDELIINMKGMKESSSNGQFEEWFSKPGDL